MAKMFYTLEEAADKLGVGEDEVKKLAETGKLQQFRDRDKLMFKRDQVDELSGGDPSNSATGGFITIEDEDDAGGAVMNLDDDLDDSIASDSGLSLETADSDDSGFVESPPMIDEEPAGAGDTQDTDAITLAEEEMAADEKEDTSQRTGISVFDADELDEPADPMAQTQITSSQVDEEELALESVGSGSGLLDLTRESDDTSLGAELLDEIYPTAGNTDAASSDIAESSVGGDTFDPAALDLSDTGDSGMGNVPSASGLENLTGAPTGSGIDNLEVDTGIEALSEQSDALDGMPSSGTGAMAAVAAAEAAAAPMSMAAMQNMAGGVGGTRVEYVSESDVPDLAGNVVGILTMLFATVFLGLGLTISVSSIMRVQLPLVETLADQNVLYGMMGGGVAIALIGLILCFVLDRR